MIATFDQGDLRFHYPENWQINDESLLEWPRTVSVQSPGSGFWTVYLYEIGTDTGQLLKETLDEMRAEYDSLESSVISEAFEDHHLTGYEMYFYCLDFLVRAKAMVGRAHDGKTVLVMWQAEDRDFDQAEPVFRAITTSLLRPAASS